MPGRYTEVKAPVGKRIREFRQRKGWSVDQLAGETEVSRRTVSRLENLTGSQIRRFVTANLHRIAEALEIPLKQLLAFRNLTGTNEIGQLRMDADGDIYWTQHMMKFWVPNFDIINHMQRHNRPGWEQWAKEDLSVYITGPPLYFKDARSDGLLIKAHNRPETYLIKDGKACRFLDEYSFGNYKQNGRLIEWHNIVPVTEGIVNDFHAGDPIHLFPTLNCPKDGETISVTTTLCCTRHSNPIWKYQFQIARDAAFPTPLVDETVLTAEFALEGLPFGTYFWRVRGVDSGRTPSGWSEVWSFTRA